MHGEGENNVEAVPASTLAGRLAFGLARLSGAAAALMVLAILVLVTLAIARRYVFEQPIPGADDLGGYMVVALIGLGMAEALRRGDHITIDIVSSRLGGGLSIIRDVWSALAVLAFAVLLAWSSYVQIKFAADFGSYTPGEIEIQSWIPMLPLFLGWILLAITAFGQLVEAFARRADR